MITNMQSLTQTRRGFLGALGAFTPAVLAAQTTTADAPANTTPYRHTVLEAFDYKGVTRALHVPQ